MRAWCLTPSCRSAATLASMQPHEERGDKGCGHTLGIPRSPTLGPRTGQLLLTYLALEQGQRHRCRCQPWPHNSLSAVAECLGPQQRAQVPEVPTTSPEQWGGGR